METSSSWLITLRPTNPTALFSMAAGAMTAWVLYRWYSPPVPDQEALPFPYEDAERDAQRHVPKKTR